ncbi:MAG: hypothetical protein ACFFBD_16720, partial [Candidatus Hodarchaeota archaeon]
MFLIRPFREHWIQKREKRNIATIYRKFRLDRISESEINQLLERNAKDPYWYAILMTIRQSEVIIRAKYNEAQQIAKEVIEEGEQRGNDLIVATGKVLASNVNIKIGRPVEAETVILEMIPILKKWNAEIILHLAYTYIGYIAYSRGEHNKALNYYEAAIFWARKGNISILGSLTDKVAVLTELGEFRQAFKLSREVVTRTRSENRIGLLIYALYDYANILISMGELGQAIKAIQECYDLTIKTENPPMQSAALYLEACVLELRGQLNEALERTMYSEQVMRKIGNMETIDEILILRGRLLTLLGRLEEGRSALEESLRLNQEMQNELYIRKVQLRLTEIDVARGHYEEAVKVIQESLEAFIKAELYDDIQYAHLVLAQIWLAQECFDDAQMELQKCHQLSIKKEDILTRIRSELALAALNVANSKFQKARRWIRSVMDISRKLGIIHYVYEAEKVHSQIELMEKAARIY